MCSSGPLGRGAGVGRRAVLAAALLGARHARAETVVPLGERRFAIPDAMLESCDRDGLVLAVAWPGLEGAMGRSLPPRRVLTVGVRVGETSVAAELRAVRLQEHGRPSPGSRFGLHELYTGRIRPETVVLVDDWADPHLVVTVPRGAGDPTQLWLPLAFDGDGVRISIRLHGTLLPEWQAIRADVAALVARLERRA
jgi:hypothetical protein